MRKASTIVLPDWLPQAAWNAFVEMRKAIHKPLTEYAKKLAIGKLAQLRELGNSPEEVLDQSILNDWQGVFAVKGAGNGQQKTYWEPPNNGACESHATFLRSIGPKATPDQQRWLKNWEAEHRI